MHSHLRELVRGALFLFGAILFLFPAVSFADATSTNSNGSVDLNLDPASTSQPLGQNFTVKVTIDPGGKKVNASDGNLIFDRDVLNVVSVSKDGSGFSLWTADPTFSNTDGTIVYSGGSPSGFSSLATVITITFKGVKTGVGKISFTKGSILAADGKGTDVYRNGNGATITITDAPAAPPPDTSDNTDSPDLSGGPTPPAPDISASAFNKQENWYSATSSIFSWRLTPDITGVRMLLADSDSVNPTTNLKPDATSTLVTGIADGTHFFLLQLKNDSGWGGIGKFKVQVDTAPPKAFDVALVAPGSDGISKLSFKTDDVLSGMDHYEVLLGSSSVATVDAKDITDGTYPTPPQNGGMQSVTINAYDKAGNIRSATKMLNLPKVLKPKAVDENAPPPQPFWSFERILLILMAFVIGGILTMQYNGRKNAAAQKARLLRSALEMVDKNNRVFSAMREEFEAMVNSFDPKPQLTPEERDLLENIKEVIDISEEIIDAGAEELKKLIRES